MYDLLTERFSYFFISPFTTSDQQAASLMLEYIQRGDLVIRDLGYFAFRLLSLIDQQGAFFITRLRYGTILHDPSTGKRIDLLKMLKKSQRADISVIVGSAEQLTVRLVALPVDPALAAERRRKLKANRDRRLNPSKEHLALLGWNIFILNVAADTLPAEKVLALYALRWRIEIIFKTWKSNFNLTAFPRTSQVHVRAYIYAFLIFVTLFHAAIFSQTNMLTANNQDKPLSLLKLSRCFREQFWAIMLYSVRPAILSQQISYHCTYEKRHDRTNYHQQVSALS